MATDTPVPARAFMIANGITWRRASRRDFGWGSSLIPPLSVAPSARYRADVSTAFALACHGQSEHAHVHRMHRANATQPHHASDLQTCLGHFPLRARICLRSQRWFNRSPIFTLLTRPTPAASSPRVRQGGHTPAAQPQMTDTSGQHQRRLNKSALLTIDTQSHRSGCAPSD